MKLLEIFDFIPNKTLYFLLGAIFILYLVWLLFFKKRYELLTCRGFITRSNLGAGTTDKFRKVEVRIHSKPAYVLNDKRELIPTYRYELKQLNGMWHPLTKKQIEEIKTSQEKGCDPPEFTLLKKYS